jgi:site-specific DNA-methyltransferase (adenine-specific)
MTPYYEDQKTGITIYHGDCREVLPHVVPDAAAVIADCPYGETSLDWDHCADGWLGAVGTYLAPRATLWCFGSMRMFLAQAGEFSAAGLRHVQDLVWEKHNGSGFHADRFKRVHELVVQFRHDGVAWADVFKSPVIVPDGTERAVRRKRRPPHMGHADAPAYAAESGGPRLMRSVIYAASCHGYAVHPTQKPEAVIAPLVEYSSPVGALVLDPFMGSGTTLVVARAMGRRAIGIEIDEAYCEAAAQRLAQGVLALPEPSKRLQHDTEEAE